MRAKTEYILGFKQNTQKYVKMPILVSIHTNTVSYVNKTFGKKLDVCQHIHALSLKVIAV